MRSCIPRLLDMSSFTSFAKSVRCAGVFYGLLWCGKTRTIQPAAFCYGQINVMFLSLSISLCISFAYSPFRLSVFDRHWCHSTRCTSQSGRAIGPFIPIYFIRIYPITISILIVYSIVYLHICYTCLHST